VNFPSNIAISPAQENSQQLDIQDDRVPETIKVLGTDDKDQAVKDILSNDFWNNLPDNPDELHSSLMEAIINNILNKQHLVIPEMLTILTTTSPFYANQRLKAAKILEAVVTSIDSPVLNDKKNNERLILGYFLNVLQDYKSRYINGLNEQDENALETAFKFLSHSRMKGTSPLIPGSMKSMFKTIGEDYIKARGLEASYFDQKNNIKYLVKQISSGFYHVEIVNGHTYIQDIHNSDDLLDEDIKDRDKKIVKKLIREVRRLKLQENVAVIDHSQMDDISVSEAILRYGRLKGHSKVAIENLAINEFFDAALIHEAVKAADIFHTYIDLSSIPIEIEGIEYRFKFNGALIKHDYAHLQEIIGKIKKEQLTADNMTNILTSLKNKLGDSFQVEMRVKDDINQSNIVSVLSSIEKNHQLLDQLYLPDTEGGRYFQEKVIWALQFSNWTSFRSFVQQGYGYSINGNFAINYQSISESFQNKAIKISRTENLTEVIRYDLSEKPGSGKKLNSPLFWRSRVLKSYAINLGFSFGLTTAAHLLLPTVFNYGLPLMLIWSGSTFLVQALHTVFSKKSFDHELAAMAIGSSLRSTLLYQLISRLGIVGMGIAMSSFLKMQLLSLARFVWHLKDDLRTGQNIKKIKGDAAQSFTAGLLASGAMGALQATTGINVAASLPGGMALFKKVFIEVPYESMVYLRAAKRNIFLRERKPTIRSLQGLARCNLVNGSDGSVLKKDLLGSYIYIDRKGVSYKFTNIQDLKETLNYAEYIKVYNHYKKMENNRHFLAVNIFNVIKNLNKVSRNKTIKEVMNETEKWHLEDSYAVYQVFKLLQNKNYRDALEQKLKETLSVYNKTSKWLQKSFIDKTFMEAVDILVSNFEKRYAADQTFDRLTNKEVFINKTYNLDSAVNRSRILLPLVYVPGYTSQQRVFVFKD